MLYCGSLSTDSTHITQRSTLSYNPNMQNQTKSRTYCKEAYEISVSHDGGFRRIPGMSNNANSVFRRERLWGFYDNQYIIVEEKVSTNIILHNNA